MARKDGGGVGFRLNEIPFAVLERVGLTQEMVEDLPERVLEAICEGRRSPLLPIRVHGAGDGPDVMLRARFRLRRDPDGNVSVWFLPQSGGMPLGGPGGGDAAALDGGLAVLAPHGFPGGAEAPCLHQKDPLTGAVLYAPSAQVARNAERIADAFGLSPADVGDLNRGVPVTVRDGARQATVGLDLNEPTGFLHVEGDGAAFRRARLQPLAEKYSFGLNGCWVQSGEGRLEYVPEEMYSRDAGIGAALSERVGRAMGTGRQERGKWNRT